MTKVVKRRRSGRSRGPDHIRLPKLLSGCDSDGDGGPVEGCEGEINSSVLDLIS